MSDTLGLKRLRKLQLENSSRLIRIEVIAAEALERARSGVDILQVLEKNEKLQDDMRTLHGRCSELAASNRRLLEEKEHLGKIIASLRQEVDDFRGTINKGLEREADLKGRLIGLIAAKVEHHSLAHPDSKLPPIPGLIDYNVHPLRAVEARHG